MPKNKFIENWETKGSKNRWLYYILNSLVWGTFSSIFIHLVSLSIKGNLWHVFSTFSFHEFSTLWIGSVIVIFIISIILWNLSKKEYGDFKNRKK